MIAVDSGDGKNYGGGVVNGSGSVGPAERRVWVIPTAPQFPRGCPTRGRGHEEGLGGGSRASSGEVQWRDGCPYGVKTLSAHCEFGVPRGSFVDVGSFDVSNLR